MSMGQKLYTIWVFFTINLKRLFRDTTALFFTFAFPLIFLFVFGSIFKDNSTSFNVAVISTSQNPLATQFTQALDKTKILEINSGITSMDLAQDKLTRGELDAVIDLGADFGAVPGGQQLPSGTATIRYTQNSEQAAAAVGSIVESISQGFNVEITKTPQPLSVETEKINANSLSTFDYTFTGLLGFAILGSSIFGPINVFPELKKMGILRRLHTTPLTTWQYFLSVMLGNAVTGLLTTVALFVVALTVFDLNVVGNLGELAILVAFGIVTLLGIGLSIGGWAKNERQAQPIANIIVFPLMFLSGTFFPRFLMPEWLQGITDYLPLTPVIDGARQILTEGAHLSDLLPQLGILAAWCVIVYAIAFRVFRWE